VVSKKAMGAKGKKSLECREGISANKCKSSLQNQEEDSSFPRTRRPDIQLLQLDKKYAFHRKRRM
jgi:hypothetical protein